MAGLLLEAAGIGGYAMAALLLAIAAALIFGKPRISFARAGSWLTFSLCAMGLLDLLAQARLQGHPAGGVVGSAIADAARAALSIPGAAVLLCAIAGAALVVATDLWALHAAQGAARLGVAGGSLAVRGAAAAIAKARTVSFGDEAIVAGEDARIVEPPRQKIALDLAAAAAEEPPQDPREPVSGDDRRRKKELFATAAGAFQSKPPVVAAPAESAEAVAGNSPPPRIVEPKAPPKPHAPVEPKPAEPVGSFTMSPGHSAFVPPPISILTGEASQAVPLDREGLTATAEKLRQKLASFGIQGQVTQIRPGPVVTMFEFLPAAGIW